MEMNIKKAAMIIIGVSVSLTISVLAVIGVYTWDPTIMGLPPHPVDTTKVVNLPAPPKPVESVKTVEITENQFKQMEDELIAKNRVVHSKDSLAKSNKKLQDSIKKLLEISKHYNDSIQSVHKYLDSTKLAKSSLNDSLTKLAKKIKKDSIKILLKQNKIDNLQDYLVAKADSSETENFKVFAKMYDATNPADVAKILEQIDERDAAIILKLMQKKKAGKVLESMTPESAAAILLLGSDK